MESDRTTLDVELHEDATPSGFGMPMARSRSSLCSGNGTFVPTPAGISVADRFPSMIENVPGPRAGSPKKFLGD